MNSQSIYTQAKEINKKAHALYNQGDRNKAADLFKESMSLERVALACEQTERSNKIMTALNAAMSKAGVHEPIMVMNYTDMSDWYAAHTGLLILAPTQELADRAAAWMVKYIKSTEEKVERGSCYLPEIDRRTRDSRFDYPQTFVCLFRGSNGD